MGSRRAGRSFWAGTLSQGIGNDAFGDCLENLLVFMEQHKSFIETLQSGGGEATVELAQTIAINDGVVFQLKLDPIFLHKCGLHNIHLEVKAWTSEADFAPLSEQQNESIEMQCL